MNQLYVVWILQGFFDGNSMQLADKSGEGCDELWFSDPGDAAASMVAMAGCGGRRHVAPPRGDDMDDYAGVMLEFREWCEKNRRNFRGEMMAMAQKMIKGAGDGAEKDG